jgi:hypothetical protein
MGAISNTKARLGSSFSASSRTLLTLLNFQDSASPSVGFRQGNFVEGSDKKSKPNFIHSSAARLTSRWEGPTRFIDDSCIEIVLIAARVLVVGNAYAQSTTAKLAACGDVRG